MAFTRPVQDSFLLGGGSADMTRNNLSLGLEHLPSCACKEAITTASNGSPLAYLEYDII